MSVASTASEPFVPPYPPRSDRPRGALSTILALRRNPIEIWGKADFERPISIGRSILGLRGAAHDPAAVRRVFLDNAANYRKDDLQLRVLRPGLGNGLLTAEGERWRLQRRSLAPLFSPRHVAEFRPCRCSGSAQAAVERLSLRRDGAVTDVGELTSRMALEVLEQTLFSQGLGREAERISAGGDELFRQFRPRRSARSHWRARRSCRGSAAGAAAPRSSFSMLPSTPSSTAARRCSIAAPRRRAIF